MDGIKEKRMTDKESSIERLGEFLVRFGIITPEQVEVVLKKQKEQPGKLFGEIAIELGYVNDKAVDEYLESKGLA